MRWEPTGSSMLMNYSSRRSWSKRRKPWTEVSRFESSLAVQEGNRTSVEHTHTRRALLEGILVMRISKIRTKSYQERLALYLQRLVLQSTLRTSHLR